MVQLHTLNTIIDDILLEARNNNIAESEQLSRIQIEQWITEYRSFLIKQDIDRGKTINQMYVQEMNGLNLVTKDMSNSDVKSGRTIHTTEVEIPKTIDFNFKSGIISITDILGNIIQLISETRSRYIKYRKYTGSDIYAYLKDRKLYVIGSPDIEYISIKGIFENPREIPGYESADAQYPIPANMLIALKELIFTKELNIVSLTDKTNDGNNDVDSTSIGRNDLKKISKGIK
jgi:hypothetical protein